MAGDNTSPKVRMLLTIGLVGVLLLLGVKFALESYFLEVTEEYERGLLPKTTEIDTMRATERANLDKGVAMPVNVAMETLAQKGRDNASEGITPQPSDDPSPLVGWAQIKHTGPMPTLAPIPTAAPEVGDAGATTTAAGDAGAPRGDAGAPHAGGAKDGGAPRRPAADGGH